MSDRDKARKAYFDRENQFGESMLTEIMHLVDGNESQRYFVETELSKAFNAGWSAALKALIDEAGG